MSKLKDKHADKLGALQAIANEVGGRLHLDYSGRGMYGKTCAAIYCDSAEECIAEAGANGLKGARTDSMGRGAVVYWPSLETEYVVVEEAATFTPKQWGTLIKIEVIPQPLDSDFNKAMEEAERQARIARHAPELLAALEAAVKLLREDGTVTKQARTAIEHATGEYQ